MQRKPYEVKISVENPKEIEDAAVNVVAESCIFIFGGLAAYKLVSTCCRIAEHTASVKIQ